MFPALITKVLSRPIEAEDPGPCPTVEFSIGWAGQAEDAKSTFVFMSNSESPVLVSEPSGSRCFDRGHSDYANGRYFCPFENEQLEHALGRTS